MHRDLPLVVARRLGHRPRRESLARAVPTERGRPNAGDWHCCVGLGTHSASATAAADASRQADAAATSGHHCPVPDAERRLHAVNSYRTRHILDASYITPPGLRSGPERGMPVRSQSRRIAARIGLRPDSLTAITSAAPCQGWEMSMATGRPISWSVIPGMGGTLKSEGATYT